MGCLEISASLLSTPLSVEVKKLGEPLQVSVSDATQRLQLACSLVCSVKEEIITKPYTELEYIESTGTQYIDTEVMLTSTSDYECVGAITELTKTGWIAGAPTWIGIHKKGHGVAATQTSSGMKYIDVEIGEKFKISIKGDKAYFNDKETNSVVRKNSSLSLFLFAYHHTNNTGSITTSTRIYSFKIWDKGALVRDLIPVIDLDGIVCMYDLVSETFFYNKGTGNFIAGPEI